MDLARAVAIACLLAVPLTPTAVAQGNAPAATQVQFEDQTRVRSPNGTVSTVAIARAQATEPFYLTVGTENGTVLNRSTTFPVNTGATGIQADISPLLDASANLTARLHNATTDEVLAEDNATITVQDRRGAIRFQDQTRVASREGGVPALVVEAAAANVPYRVEVRLANGDLVNRTAVLSAERVLQGSLLQLDPVIEETSRLELTILDAVTDAVLDQANGTLTVAPAEATITVHDQAPEVDASGVVSTVVVREVSANVAYYVDAHAPNRTVPLVESPRFAAAGTHANVTLALHPALSETTELTFGVHTPDGTELARETATITVGSADGAGEDPTNQGASTPGPSAGLAVLAAVGALLLARKPSRR